MLKRYNCRQCGKEIISDYNNPKKYCDIKCKTNYWNKHRPNGYYKKKKGSSKCKTCGVKISSTHANQKVCSSQCYERESKWQAINRYKKHLEKSRQLLNRANSIVFVND